MRMKRSSAEFRCPLVSTFCIFISLDAGKFRLTRAGRLAAPSWGREASVAAPDRASHSQYYRTHAYRKWVNA
jgi:hypothetical protein